MVAAAAVDILLVCSMSFICCCLAFCHEGSFCSLLLMAEWAKEISEMGRTNWRKTY